MTTLYSALAALPAEVYPVADEPFWCDAPGGAPKGWKSGTQMFPSSIGHGLELRNNFHRLVCHRRAAGAEPCGPHAWARATAVLSTLLDEDPNVASVTLRAREIGLALPRSALLQAAWEASAIHASGSNVGLPGAEALGQLLRVTREERRDLKLRRLEAADETGRDRQLRERRERAKAHRQVNGATPREASAAQVKPWIAAGMKKRTWYRHRRKASEVALIRDLSHKDKEEVTKQCHVPENVTKQCHLEGGAGE